MTRLTTVALFIAALSTGAIGPAGSAEAQAPAAAPPPACAASAGFGFVCGATNPEDLALIPGTRWLIATGFAPGAGLKLVDTRARGLATWYHGEAAQIARDAEAYPQCATPPDPATFNVQGLSLKARPGGGFTLYAANHGGREAIEVFRVEAAGARPTLTWLGCLPMPPGGFAANAVTAFRDGTVLVTVLTRPGTTISDFVQGRITGGVWAWGPGDTAFRLLPGTELPGNNGLEVSRDDRRFFVVAFGWHAVLVYDRADTRRPLRRIEAPDFMPDNIHQEGDRLIAAGMRLDEPACGGRRKVVNGVADMMTCHRGYVAAELDPDAGLFRDVAYAEPDPAFNAISTAEIVGDELWFGSFRSDRIAWRKLPTEPAPR